ncbi:hypothetical protein [Nocardia thraciensis]
MVRHALPRIAVLVLGSLSDVFGRRRMFMINIGLYAGRPLETHRPRVGPHLAGLYMHR